jgi:hypothetical protein
MTIVQEEVFSCKGGILPSFTRLRLDAEEAILRDTRALQLDEEKKRLLRAPVTYDEFKSLLSSVHLKPIRRRSARCEDLTA